MEAGLGLESERIGKNWKESENNRKELERIGKNQKESERIGKNWKAQKWKELERI